MIRKDEYVRRLELCREIIERRMGEVERASKGARNRGAKETELYLAERLYELQTLNDELKKRGVFSNGD